jgi:hypothetical protein
MKNCLSKSLLFSLPVVVNLSATDPNNLALTYSVTNNPAQGT